jgi:hypothetical protein
MCKTAFCYAEAGFDVSGCLHAALSTAADPTTTPKGAAMNLPPLLLRIAAAVLLAGCTTGIANAGGRSGGGGGGSGGGDPALPGEVLVKLRSTAALQPLLLRQSLSLTAALVRGPSIGCRWWAVHQRKTCWRAWHWSPT